MYSPGTLQHITSIRTVVEHRSLKTRTGIIHYAWHTYFSGEISSFVYGFPTEQETLLGVQRKHVYRIFEKIPTFWRPYVLVVLRISDVRTRSAFRKHSVVHVWFPVSVLERCFFNFFTVLDALCVEPFPDIQKLLLFSSEQQQPLDVWIFLSVKRAAIGFFKYAIGFKLFTFVRSAHVIGLNDTIYSISILNAFLESVFHTERFFKRFIFESYSKRRR